MSESTTHTRRQESTPRSRSPERRIRDAVDALAVELELLGVDRLRDAFTSASWSALQTISRLAQSLGAFATPPGPATSLRFAARREIARRPRYRLGERLGAGGMAEVFRAWKVGEMGFARPVAVKRLLPHVVQSHPWLVMHEAKVLSRMLHPNIVHVLDVALDDDGQPLLVLEYVDGINLGKLVESGPLPISVILFLAAEVLNGLGYAHHLPADGSDVRGVVHRDLSPDNILLSWEGVVKVADFGIARVRDTTEVSMAPGIHGKPRYMSPEQQLGRPLDGRSDLYSVGVILWELLAHERLFGDAAAASDFDRLVPRPSEFRWVPRDLEAVVMKLLRRDRDRRYRTAEAAHDAIARCDGSTLLRGRVELVELLAERFPAQADRRSTRCPPMPHTPTPKTLPFPSATPRRTRWLKRSHAWLSRGRWRLRRARWERQRRRARRLPQPRWPAIALSVLCVALSATAALGLLVSR